MKLPGLLSNVLPKKPEEVEQVYLTCVFHKESVDACVWDIGPKKKPTVTASVSEIVSGPSWLQRQEAVRLAISKLRSETGLSGSGKVVLGLPSEFLTQSGDIEPGIRKELGMLLKNISLVPLGFVPVHQAIIYSLKQEEGIPPNVILLDISKGSTHLYLYKVGQLSGEKTFDTTSGIVGAVEQCLRGFANVEVLPSRMLLFGGDTSILESSQAELLKHPWQSRANFLHFPRIDIYVKNLVLSSVSIAGASELMLIPDTEADTEPTEAEQIKDEIPESAVTQKVDDNVSKETNESEIQEESNVRVVPADELGFSAQKSVDNNESKPESVADEEEVVGEPIVDPVAARRKRLGLSRPELRIPHIPAFGNLIAVLAATKVVLLIPLVLVFLALVIGALYWFVPKATLTVYLSPQTITEEQAITIDPGVTTVDPVTKVVPGKLQEKSISGETTVPVTGKKKVGDPARGTITIYNKSSSLRTFRKGTILVSGSLQFSLDADIQVASASENLASSQLTYGKVNTTITAVAIGPESNMAANADFQFKDISTSIASARNDQPLTGGTSRDVSVVTRNDQDTIVKLLTDELTQKATSELTGGLTLSDTLIEETVKTAIAQKTFSKELNEEATDLTGSVTVNATGITYAATDVLTFLKDLIASRVPPGYTLLEEETTTDVGEVEIAKNGKITTLASIHSLAAPEIDTKKIQSETAGKTFEQLQEYLKNFQGVGGTSVTFKYSPIRNRLPLNQANISVAIALQK